VSDDGSLHLDNQLCFALYAASRLVTQAYQPHLERLGLTYAQYLVLLVLWERDGQTVSELGDRLLLDSGTLTPLLKRLQRGGLIARARRDCDERAVENRLTAAGRELRAQAAGVPLALMCDVGLAAEEAGETQEVVRRLLAKLQRVSR
jgi:DNA-binding MarR family transcriptional regulator